MADTIYEIYTDDSGAFTVGSIAADNGEDMVISRYKTQKERTEKEAGGQG